MLHARKSYNERVQDNANIIPEKEPVFLLRGQDVLAPALLDIYVAMTRNLDGFDPEIAMAVTEHAQRMRAWQQDYINKIADMDKSDNITQ